MTTCPNLLSLIWPLFSAQDSAIQLPAEYIEWKNPWAIQMQLVCSQTQDWSLSQLVFRPAAVHLSLFLLTSYLQIISCIFFASLFLLILSATSVLCWPLQNPSNRSLFLQIPSLYSPSWTCWCDHVLQKHPLCFSITTWENLKHELTWPGPLWLGPVLHLTVLCYLFPSSRTPLWASVLLLRAFSLPVVFLSFFCTWWAPSITV